VEDTTFNLENPYCQRCWTMTTSLEGLRALKLREGYRHYAWHQLLEEARNGCPLCVIIFKWCRGKWNKDSDASLRFFAECKDGSTSFQIDEDGISAHEFENQPFYAITASSPTFVRLIAFTGTGKALLLTKRRLIAG
jgi:hypothetical protein